MPPSHRRQTAPDGESDRHSCRPARLRAPSPSAPTSRTAPAQARARPDVSAFEKPETATARPHSCWPARRHGELARYAAMDVTAAGAATGHGHHPPATPLPHAGIPRAAGSDAACGRSAAPVRTGPADQACHNGGRSRRCHMAASRVLATSLRPSAHRSSAIRTGEAGGSASAFL